MTMTRGSIMSLIKDVHKKTSGTGMKDDVPARIVPHHKRKRYAAGGDIPDQGQGMPAALSEGEYVIPADIVSMLGDGNTEAGAKVLDGFVKHIRQLKGKHLAKGNQAPPLT